MKEIVDICIVGAGFSGTMVLYQLAKHANRPLKVALFEKEHSPGLGIAYSTTDPCHLLNVRVSAMSALPDDRDHFFDWLKDNEPLWRSLHPSFGKLIVDKKSFFPRMIYGRYLNWFWHQTLFIAKEKDISISLYHEAAEAVQFSNGCFTINDQVLAKQLVLAAGLTKRFFPLTHPCFIHEGWRFDFSKIDHADEETIIALIGSSLTMLDTLSSLDLRDYPGKVIAISREGKLPEEHKELPQDTPSFLNPKTPPQTARGLLREFRSSIAEAEKAGYDWRSVIDFFRYSAETFWEALPSSEKKKLKRFLSIWNRQRHRMPSEYLLALSKFKKEGRFSQISGRIVDIKEARDMLQIFYRKDGKVDFVLADYVINCAGPEYSITKTSNKLVKSLFSSKLAKPNDLETGLALTKENSAKGIAEGSLYVIGHLAFGERLETTAVPDLRQDAEKIAKSLLAKIQM